MLNKIKVKIWQKINRWTILEEVFWYRTKSWIPLRKFKCKCECWKEKEVLLCSLLWNKSKSCWCLQKENHFLKHWMVWTKFYNTYRNILKRCNSLWEEWRRHWEKWIKCEWNTFEEFKKDMYEDYEKYADIYWEKKISIDRINWNGNYCKNNCRWTTNYEQNRNMKSNIWFTYKWNTLILTDWCSKLWLNYKKVCNRKSSGWTIEEALEIKKRW